MVKTPLAILLSAVLLWSQTLLAASPSLQRPQPQCARCDCGKNCCVGQTASAPVPSSAIPSPASSSEQLLSAPSISGQLVIPLNLPPPAVCSSFLSSISSNP